MRAFIDQIDITTDGKVRVSGQLSQTNLTASLNEQIYINEPEDGIWGYTLEVIPKSAWGAEILVPFSVDAPWFGNNNSNGVRVYQKSITPGKGLETLQLKAKKVKSFTTEQVNQVFLKGAQYNTTYKQLIIDLVYSGGCFPHSFALEWDGATLESFPPQYNFNLIDLSEYDPCKGLIPVQLRFDIDTPGVQLELPSTINLGTAGFGASIRVKLK